MTDDAQPCTKEHPNPHLGPHRVEVLKKMPGYFKWWCPNCGIQVVEAGHGAGDE